MQLDQSRTSCFSVFLPWWYEDSDASEKPVMLLCSSWCRTAWSRETTWDWKSKLHVWYHIRFWLIIISIINLTYFFTLFFHVIGVNSAPRMFEVEPVKPTSRVLIEVLGRGKGQRMLVRRSRQMLLEIGWLPRIALLFRKMLEKGESMHQVINLVTGLLIKMEER